MLSGQWNGNFWTRGAGLASTAVISIWEGHRKVSGWLRSAEISVQSFGSMFPGPVMRKKDMMGVAYLTAVRKERKGRD